VHDDTQDGVLVDATAGGTVDVDFGNSNLGLNSFFDNGGLDLNNINSGDYTISAEGNFRGTSTPTIGEDLSVGVNAATPLPVNPNQ
jgi:hypothetical protein